MVCDSKKCLMSVPLISSAIWQGANDTKEMVSWEPTYIHTYIHTYTHTYIHTYIHTNTHTYTDRQTHTHTHTHTDTHVQTNLLTFLSVCWDWPPSIPAAPRSTKAQMHVDRQNL